MRQEGAVNCFLAYFLPESGQTAILAGMVKGSNQNAIQWPVLVEKVRVRGIKGQWIAVIFGVSVSMTGRS